MPKTRCSSSSIGSPVPIPRIMRPPPTSSTAAASFASIPAVRSVALVTRVPTAMRLVAAATAASDAYASSDGRSGAAPGGNRWSNAKTPSNPRSSARRANASTRPASPENIGRTSPTFTSDHHAPELLEREGGRAHGPGVVAELGRDDRHTGAMFGSLHRVEVGGARGVEQEVARDDRATTDDDDLRVQDVHEAGDPLAEPTSGLHEDPPRGLVALPRRLRDELAGHLVGVTAGETTQDRALVFASLLTAHPIDRPAGGDLLPAAAVPAAAERATGLDDDVADLGGETVRAAEQPAVRHDPATDPRAHRDEQQMPVPATRAEPELTVRGHARVVVHLAGKTECVAHPFGDREVAPGEVGGEAQDAFLRVDQAGGPHADRRHVRGRERPGELDHGGQRRHLVLRGGRRTRALGDRAVARDTERVDLGAADVEPDRLAAPTFRHVRTSQLERTGVVTRSRSARSPWSRSGSSRRRSRDPRARRSRPAPRGRTRGRRRAGARPHRAPHPVPRSPPCRSGRTRRCTRAAVEPPTPTRRRRHAPWPRAPVRSQPCQLLPLGAAAGAYPGGRANTISRWSPTKLAPRTSIRWSVCGRIRLRL